MKPLHVLDYGAGVLSKVVRMAIVRYTLCLVKVSPNGLPYYVIFAVKYGTNAEHIPPLITIYVK